jgi:hypothetical protein
MPQACVQRGRDDENLGLGHVEGDGGVERDDESVHVSSFGWFQTGNQRCLNRP